MAPANDPSSQFIFGALQLSSAQGIINASRADVLKLHTCVEDYLDEVEAIIQKSSDLSILYSPWEMLLPLDSELPRA